MRGVGQFANFLCGGASVHDGHLYIHQHQRIFVIGGRLHFFDGDFAVGREVRFVTEVLQYFRFDFQIDFVVLDNKNLFAAGASI